LEKSTVLLGSHTGDEQVVKGMIRASVIRPEEYMHFPDFLSGFARMEAWNLFLWAVVCLNGGVQTALLVDLSRD
jgi:hypothetical protein